MQVLPQFIPDLFADVVTRVAATLGYAVYYDFGHRAEITRNLAEKDGSISFKNQKYPLVWLVMDFQEDKGNNIELYSQLSGITVVICTGTEVGYTQQQRRDLNYMTLLLPIYAEFLNQIQLSTVFRSPLAGQIKHAFFLRPYWGTQDANGSGTANLFNDYIDAIEIKNLKLDVKRKLC